MPISVLNTIPTAKNETTYQIFYFSYNQSKLDENRVLALKDGSNASVVLFGVQQVFYEGSFLASYIRSVKIFHYRAKR